MVDSENFGDENGDQNDQRQNGGMPGPGKVRLEIDN